MQMRFPTRPLNISCHDICDIPFTLGSLCLDSIGDALATDPSHPGPEFRIHLIECPALL